MTKEEIKPLARIAVFMVSGYLMNGGWLPEDVAELMRTDPAMVELAAGAILGVVTLGIYWFSNARKALRSIFS